MHYDVRDACTFRTVVPNVEHVEANIRCAALNAAGPGTYLVTPQSHFKDAILMSSGESHNAEPAVSRPASQWAISTVTGMPREVTGSNDTVMSG